MAGAKTLLFWAAALALAASPAAFADIGPPPDPGTLPYVVVNATFEGAPVPDDTAVEVHCLINGTDYHVPAASLSCTGGVCSNSGWYKLSPCVDSEYATAVFEFSHPLFGAVNTSPAVPVQGGKTLYYSVGITRSGAAISPQAAGGAGGPSCPLGLAVLALGACGIALSRAAG